MARLPKKYIKQAWAMKGSNSKNALKRAWKLYRSANATGKKSTAGKTPRRQSRPSKGGPSMARRKDFSVSLTNLAGLGIVNDITDFTGQLYNVLNNKASATTAAKSVLSKVSDVDRYKKNLVPLAGVMIAKAFLGRRQIGRLGRFSVRV